MRAESSPGPRECRLRAQQSTDRNRRLCIRLLTLIAVLALAGCAAPGRETPGAGPSPQLQEIARALPGRYLSVTDADGHSAVQHLTVRPQSVSESKAVGFVLSQRGTVSNDATRRFGLVLRPGAVANRFEGEFAPLGADGRASNSCDMQFQLSDRGLVGETDPARCRFGEGENATGLLKELAFDGRRLVIGERLLNLDDGRTRGRDEVLTFLPAARFTGWAGIREGGSWRVANSLALEPDRAAVEAHDASEMSLGFAIDLQYYRMDRDDQPVLLRLTVRDAEDGEVLGQAWSDPGAERIGLALPEIQVGLERR